MSELRYVFLVEWFDTQASVIRKFNFTYYPKQQSIEMYDLKNNKNFLKRIQYPQLKIEDLYIGNVLTVFSRQLTIVDYADVFTRNNFASNQNESTFAMIKPDAYLHIGKIITRIEESGLTISNLRMTRMTKQNAENFYAEHRGKPFFEGLVNQMSSDLIVGLELVGIGAVAKWRQIIGPTNPDKARQEAPNSLRALYGDAGPKNVVHGSDSPGSAARELDFFFHYQSELKNTAIFSNCTLGLIKPHIVKQKKVGPIIDRILAAGFEISALQIFQMDRATSNEFFEVYQGVLPEYSQVAEHMTSGSCVAIEIRQDDVVNKFRSLCGPHDPAIAKVLQPGSIRAHLGNDRVTNAVHCTDLPEDGTLEVQYFFNVLMVPGWKKI